MATKENLLNRLKSLRGTENEPGNVFPLSGGTVPQIRIDLPQRRATETGFSPRGVTGQIFDPSLEISKSQAGPIFENVQGLGMAMRLFDEADKLIPAQNDPAKAVLTGMGRSFGTTSIGRLTGFADEKARAFSKFRDAFGTLLARAFGEKGVVTNQDVKRVMEAFPKFDDSSEGRQISKKFIKDLLMDRIIRFQKVSESIGAEDPEVRSIFIGGPENG